MGASGVKDEPSSDEHEFRFGKDALKRNLEAAVSAVVDRANDLAEGSSKSKKRKHRDRKNKDKKNRHAREDDAAHAMDTTESTISSLDSPENHEKSSKKIKVKHESTDGGSPFQSSPKKAPKTTFPS